LASDSAFYSADCLKFITANPEEIVGTFGNGRIGRNFRGRPSNVEVRLKSAGDALRDQLNEKMEDAGLKRVSLGNKKWDTDNCNHVVEHN